MMPNGHITRGLGQSKIGFDAVNEQAYGFASASANLLYMTF